MQSRGAYQPAKHKCNLARQAVQGKLGVKYQVESSRQTRWHVGLEFCKQQVVGSIPITGSIFLKLNQADFGKSQRSITEKCPPIFNLA